MLFTKSFIVKTTHLEATPLVDWIPIAHGIITFVSIWMPPGCNGLVYCKLKHHEHTVFPSTEDMFLMTSGISLEWTEYYESYQPPYELKFVGWSFGTTYDHVVTVRIAVLPRKAVLALAIVDAIKGMLGVLSPKRIFTRS
ncbi:hypothetical protein ES708_32942 [subsurface metagenome]